MCRFEGLPKNVADTANPRRYWRCPAPLFTGHLPDTSTSQYWRGFQPMVSGCPALLRFPHVHARAPARTASKTPGHRGIPDTTSNGAGFRCPVGVRLSFVPDTASKHGKNDHE